MTKTVDAAVDARPGARLDGPRARARHHDQGPGRARLLHGARRRDLPAAPHRHARPRRLHLRGQPSASPRARARCSSSTPSQGVEAQTLANTYLAVDAGLELIPCLNKIDLPGAEPERVAEEVADLLGEPADSILRISGKTGEGVEDVLEELVAKVPPPCGDPDAEPRALIFDSEFDQYRGVIAYIRVVDGVFKKGEAIRAMAAGTEADIDDIGFFTPGDDERRRAARRRGRLPHHRHQGRHEAARRRHADDEGEQGDRAGARLPRGQADGVLRRLPDRLRRLPRPPRRAREAHAQRRRADLGARDVRRARVRLPRRLPRAAAHGHRARAARARVRPRPARDDAVGRLRGHADERRGARDPRAERHARPGPDRRGARALHQGLDPHAEGVRRPGDGARPGANAASTPGCTT